MFWRNTIAAHRLRFLCLFLCVYLFLFFYFFLRHLVHQTYCYILYRQVLHFHSLQDSDQVVIQGDNLSNKDMATTLFFTGTSKQTRWSANVLLLLIWSNKTSHFCILHVKNLRRTHIMLDELLILWNLQSFFHVYVGCFELLICINWVFANLNTIMDIAFLTHFGYSFNTLGLVLKGGASLYSSAMSQRSIETTSISNLHFRKFIYSPVV